MKSYKEWKINQNIKEQLNTQPFGTTTNRQQMGQEILNSLQQNQAKQNQTVPKSSNMQQSVVQIKQTAQNLTKQLDTLIQQVSQQTNQAQ